jgi:outer membrane protein TolC
MSWNFDGTVSDAKARSLRYAAKQSLAKARAAEEMVAVQAGTAFIEYTTAKMGLDTAKAALVNARQARDSSRELYRQNKIDATSFSTATYAVVRESNAYSKAVFNYNNSLSKLFRYTAIWPSGVSETLDEAVNVLKEG